MRHGIVTRDADRGHTWIGEAAGGRGGPRVLSQILPKTGPSDLDLALLGAGDRLERSERQGTLPQGLRPDQVRSHEVSAKAGQLHCRTFRGRTSIASVTVARICISGSSPTRRASPSCMGHGSSSGTTYYPVPGAGCRRRCGDGGGRAERLLRRRSQASLRADVEDVPLIGSQFCAIRVVVDVCDSSSPRGIAVVSIRQRLELRAPRVPRHGPRARSGPGRQLNPDAGSAVADVLRHHSGSGGGFEPATSAL